MQEFVEVEYRTGRLGYFLNSENIDFQPEDWIVIEVERGEDMGKVVHTALRDPEVEKNIEEIKKKKIIRVASEEDFHKLENVKENEDIAHERFVECVEKYPFEMKLVGTIYQFDGNKLTFFFTAEGRIDFRLFVRELASIFRTRIELHQTSGRDEAKRLGGYGMCGYRYCCASYMKRFNQVTIKMAKDQNLSNNLSKISGPCGRLLCCLHYEENFYVETSKEFPEMGEEVFFNKERMYVYKIDCYNKKVHLSNDNQTLEVIELADFNKLKKCRKCRR